MSSPKYPKGERVWVSYYNADHKLIYVLTSKEPARDCYFLYELVNGAFKKLGKAASPTELEEKFNVDERLGCTTSITHD